MKKLLGLVSSKTSQLKELFASRDEAEEETGRAAASELKAPQGSRHWIITRPHSHLDPRAVSPPKEQYEANTLLLRSSTQLLSTAIKEMIGQIDTDQTDCLDNLKALLDLLESDQVSEEVEELPSWTSGRGRLGILLSNIQHPRLIEFCLQFKLASALFQVMRVLRIIEVMIAKSDLPQGVTVDSSRRVSCLLSRLCEEPQVLEEIRPHLSKLLCFPISSKPGFHLQRDVAEVVRSLCSKALTWSIVWFLHDNHVVQHMLAALQRISVDSEGIESSGLWLVGVQCVVDLVASSTAISGALVQDYHSAQGDGIISELVRRSHRDRVPQLLALVMRLFFDCAKGPDRQTQPFPVIIANNLRIILCIDDFNLAPPDASIPDLMQSCQRFLDSVNLSDDDEHFLQHCCSSMLSLYSDENINLKEAFSFHELSSLILVVPILKSADTISSILTVLTYCCQFYSLPQVSGAITCVSATMSYLTYLSFEYYEDKSDFSKTLLRLEILIKSLTTIMRSNPTIIQLLLQHLLPYFMSNSIHQAVVKIASHSFSEEFLENILSNVFFLLNACLTHPNSHNFDEVRISRLPLLCRTVLNAFQTPLGIFKQVVRYFSAVCQSDDESFCVESLQYLIELSRILFDERMYSKVHLLFETIIEVMHNNKFCINAWEIVSGFDFVKELLLEFGNRSLLYASDEGVLSQIQTLFRSILRCISVSLSYDRVENATPYKPVDKSRSRKYFIQLGRALVSSDIFRSDKVPCETVVDMILGKSDSIPLCLAANPGVVEILFEILPSLSLKVTEYSLKLLHTFVASDIIMKQKMCEFHLVRIIAERFYSILLEKESPLRETFLDIIRECCEDYLSIPDLISLFTQIIRNEVLIFSNLDTLRDISPWNCESEKRLIKQGWLGVDLLMDLANFDTLHRGSPYISFNPKTGLSFLVSNVSDVSFTLWLNIPNSKDTGIINIWSILNEDMSETIISFSLDVLNSSIVLQCPRFNPPKRIFDIPTRVYDSTWHLITINIRKITLRNVAHISIYFDSSLCERSDNSELELKVSSKSRIRNIVIGALTNDSGDSCERNFTDELWKCGLIRVFSAPLTQKQIVHCYLKGPGYLGTYRDEDPLHELPSVYSSIALLNVKRKHVASAAVIDNIGQSGIGLELINDPTLEISKHALTQSIDHSPFPEVEYYFGAQSIESRLESSQEPQQLTMATLSLQNSADVNNNSKNSAKCFVHYPGFASPFSESFSSCLAALGGPPILFPLLHILNDEDQLINCLHLLVVCSKLNAANLKFMQTSGHKTLSFILSRKDSRLLTHTVFSKVLQFAIQSFNDEEDGFDSHLLYDATAFYHLIMNHQVIFFHEYS